MKKCLTIALLVVAVAIVAVVPVSAVAPLIDPLPRILIGDEGGSFEIQQAFLVDDYVDWTHGGTQNAGRKQEAMHVYLRDETSNVMGYNNDGDFPDLGADGVAALVALALPDAAKDQDIQSNWGPTADEQFLRWISLKAAAAGAYDVSFYAAISAGDQSTTSTVSNLPVKAVAGAEDAVQFETKQPIVAPANAEIVWEIAAPPGFTGPDVVQVGTAVGWDVGPSLPAAGSFHFSTMKPRDTDGDMFFIPYDGGGLDEPVFKATLLLTNDAATTIAQSPGYRVDFFNSAQTHRGTVTVVAGVDVLGPCYPFVGEDYATSIMWSTPMTMSDMGDGGRIAAFFFAPSSDGRDYSIQFDVIDYAGTIGKFMVKQLSVMTYEAAEDLTVTPGPTWDGAAAGASFADWNGEGGLDLGGGVILGPGASSKTDASFTFGTGGTSGLRFEKGTPSYLAADNLAAVPNTMARFRAELASTDIAKTPILRLYMSRQPVPYYSWNEDWGAGVSVGGVKDNGQFGGQPAGAVNPGVPLEGGSVITSYFLIPPTNPGEYILPQLQTWSVGAYGGANAWEDDGGSFEITKVSVDTVE